jgi:hypothetical protein
MRKKKKVMWYIPTTKVQHYHPTFRFLFVILQINVKISQIGHLVKSFSDALEAAGAAVLHFICKPLRLFSALRGIFANRL